MAKQPPLGERQPPPPTTLMTTLLKQTDLLFTFGLFGVVMLLVIPIPPMLMDFLLAFSIGMSLLILLVVIYVKDPSEFNVFPTILLSVTLFRLGLNVASTRLILLDGFAGHVIDSFGQFVVRGNYVVGTVVFTILVIINFVVITKGAGRIAEVAARFTLDAMPGKQMAIDAELNAGIIDETTATVRRSKIQKEADFYGAMDGASKFVRGDAVAGILITIINITGGISIGVFQKGLPAMESVQKFSILSIGDGIVSQVPALIISVAAGILTTRTSSSDNLGAYIGKQLTIYPKAIGIAASMLLLFAIMPGMPFAPFFTLGVLCGMIAFVMKKQGLDVIEESYQDPAVRLQEKKKLAGPGGPQSGDGADQDQGASPLRRQVADMKTLIQVEPFTIELGYGLIPLTDRNKGGDLLDRITGARQTCATQLGIIVPAAAVRDNLELDANEYQFKVRDKVVAHGNIMPNRWMAMNVSDSGVSLKGVPTVEPVFGLDAVWIGDDERKTAEINGYTVVDAPSVLITHLSETLKDVAYLLLEREDVQKLIDIVKEKNPTLISELLPDLVTVGTIQRVLQNLLSEKIPIKNLSIILETIADFASYTKNPDELSEQVRKRLGVYFIQLFEYDSGKLKSLTLDPVLEHHLISRIKRTQFEVGLLMDPQITDHILRELRPRINRMAEEGWPPIITVTAELRLAFKRFFDPSFPKLIVLAYQEMPNQTQVESVGIITAPNSLLNSMPQNPEQAANIS